MNAAPSIDEILAQTPQLNEHSVAPPALAPLSRSRELERDLRASLEAAPDARAFAALGNLLSRRALYLPARDCYERAAENDPSFAAAHLAIAELSSLLRDEERAQTSLAAALALSRRFDDPLPVGTRVSVLLLLGDATYAVNSPLELILDRSRFAIHKLYVGARPHEDAPAFHRAICGFSPSKQSERMANVVRDVLGGAPVLNAPEAIGSCARERLPLTLAGLRSVSAVTTRLVAARNAEGITLPALVRPAGTQAGHGLAKIQHREELRAHISRFPSRQYHVSPFVDYVSDDGLYRKYRIVIVNGVAYPYHLAISTRWMVHYFSSPMEEHAWMRDEERAFLDDPQSVFPDWYETTASIVSALSLDYVGLDVTRLSDGSMLVFEADPTMLVHDEDVDGPFAYKRAAVSRIREALSVLLSSTPMPGRRRRSKTL